jgi:hypothetical protein
VAISLGLGSALALWWFDMPLAVVAQRIVNSLDSTTLLAVPMFIFAAALFNVTGLTTQLFDFIRMLIGRIRGGLGYVAVLTHLVFSGVSPDRKLMEIAELPKNKHPFFVGTQFHPELLARPLDPHPLFTAFIEAAKEKGAVAKKGMSGSGKSSAKL